MAERIMTTLLRGRRPGKREPNPDIRTPLPAFEWDFRCRVLRVVDGDTLDAYVDRGLGDYSEVRVRLLGIDAPEKNRLETRVAGLAAMEYVARWVAEREDATEAPWPFLVRSRLAGPQTDDFKRILGLMWDVRTGECLNLALVEAGHAIEWRG